MKPRVPPPPTRYPGTSAAPARPGPGHPAPSRSGAVQPLLFGLAVGAAAAAGLGYLYDRYVASDTTRLRVRGYTTAYGPWRDPVLSNAIGETVRQVDQGGVNVRTVVTGRNSGQTNAAVAGGYDVDIDPLSDRDQRLAYLHHELTHVAADRRYPINSPGGAGVSFYNVRSRANPTLLQVGQIRQKLVALGNQGVHIVTNDAALSHTLRTHCLGRLNNYLLNNTLQEFDTVVNELLLYLYLKGAQGTTSYNFFRQVAAQRQYVRSL